MAQNGKIEKIREAFANYVASEGCSCCQNIKAHEAALAEIAKLLDIPMYSDKSGYDVYRFKTPTKKNQRA